MKIYPLVSLLVMLAVAAGVFFYSRSNELIDNIALQIGNGALWLITLISYLLIAGSLKDTNPNAMVRAKMSGTILKFFTVIILVLAYIFINDREIPHKANIFVFLGMYVVYIAIEALFLSNMARNKNRI